MTNQGLMKFLLAVGIVLIALFFVYGAVLIYIVDESINQRERTEQIAEDNLKSNCIDRRVAENRIISTTVTLEVLTGPEPLPGISRQAIERGLERDQAAVDSKGFLDCHGVTGLPPRLDPDEVRKDLEANQPGP